ncbi:alpha/beta fold hydrolase [Streptomyces sp. NBC_01530]|uniref:alpha/beta fold hydrolase n=1 Tax=Streptomyces sp. NBC_01530 TaxID=2903895 RepID=UPI003870795B
MAVRDTAARLDRGLVLIDAVGVCDESEPSAAHFALEPRPRGESDRIVTPACGAAYAAALGDRRLVEVVPKGGHLPQIGQPEVILALIDDPLRRAGPQADSRVS